MTGSDWRLFMREHWKAVAAFADAVVLAVAGTILVFLWFVVNAQFSGIVPVVVGSWSMANLVTFILYSVFWEVLLVGPLVAIIVVLAWRWWKRLPEHERSGYSFRGRSRSTSGGSGLSLLFFIVFCMKVYVDGRWNVPIGTFTVNYVVGSVVTILLWGLAIVGIPAAIALTWWISREIKRSP